MAAADCPSGGTWRPVQLCRENPALLCGRRAFSGEFLRRTRQTPRKIDCGGWQCRTSFEPICAAAPTRLGRPIQTVSFGGGTEWPGSASGSRARVAGRRRRFPFPIADDFLEWSRDRSAAAGSSRFFCPRVSSTLCSIPSFTVNVALERPGALSVSALQAEAGSGRSASARRRRPAISGVFILSGGVGVPANRLSRMRRGEPRQASRLYCGGTPARSRRSLRQLPELYQDSRHDEERAGGTDRG